MHRQSIILDAQAFGLLDCRMADDSDKETPLQAKPFLDTRNIMRSEN